MTTEQTISDDEYYKIWLRAETFHNLDPVLRTGRGHNDQKKQLRSKHCIAFTTVLQLCPALELES